MSDNDQMNAALRQAAGRDRPAPPNPPPAELEAEPDEHAPVLNMNQLLRQAAGRPQPQPEPPAAA